MNAANRPLDYRAPGKGTIGRLTEQEFDALELVQILGGDVTVQQLALRWDAKPDTVNRRMHRMVRAGLVDQRMVINENRRGAVRFVYYTISETGHDLFREAWAALDAACEEEAA